MSEAREISPFELSFEAGFEIGTDSSGSASENGYS